MTGSIYVKLGGGLGNQLFQLSFSYILAKLSGRRVYASASTLLPVHEVFYPMPADTDFSKALILDGHVVRTSQIEAALEADRDIVLAGYFQRYAYYEGFKQELTDLAEMLLPRTEGGGGDDELVFHVRAGDYRSQFIQQRYMQPTPLSFFTSAYKTRQWQRATIVTDDASDPLVQALADFSQATIISQSQLSDFNYIRNSSHVVLSSSTFSWWAAWLSNASSIYAPRLGNWNPLLRPDIDLRVAESRYRHSSSLSVLSNFCVTKSSPLMPKYKQLGQALDLNLKQRGGQIFCAKTSL